MCFMIATGGQRNSYAQLIYNMASMSSYWYQKGWRQPHHTCDAELKQEPANKPKETADFCHLHAAMMSHRVRQKKLECSINIAILRARAHAHTNKRSYANGAQKNMQTICDRCSTWTWLITKLHHRCFECIELVTHAYFLIAFDNFCERVYICQFNHHFQPHFCVFVDLMKNARTRSFGFGMCASASIWGPIFSTGAHTHTQHTYNTRT